MAEDAGMSYKEVVSSQWALGKTGSTLSNASDLSSTKRTWTPFGLHIIPNVVEDSDRITLPATIEELFCFFRVYVGTIAKTQIFCLIEGSINWFFWYHVQNLIFNSLPHVFVQVFIAAYAPEDHFYLDKMNPLLYGYNFIVIISAFFELLRFVSTDMFLVDYVWQGLTMKSPWNACSDIYRATMILNNNNFTIECFDIENFTKIITAGLKANKTLHFAINLYYLRDDARNVEFFQLPQMRHFRTRWDTRKKPFQETPFAIYFLLIWGLAALHHNQFFKKLIWKIIRFACYAEIAIHLAITVHIFLSYNILQPELKNTKIIRINIELFEYLELDIDIFTIALCAPPVVHVLISRSTNDHNKIQCKSLSALLVGSCALYNFFNGLIFSYIKTYCEALVGVELHYSNANEYAFFYIYSIYFSYFLLGNIYHSIALLVKLTTDFYLLVITYHCLVETVICEWKFVTRIMILAFLTLMALLTFLLFSESSITIMFLYFKVAALTTELIGIYILYPLGRLIEDIIFQSGNEPHILQKVCLRIVPVYLGYKIYLLVAALHDYQYSTSRYVWYIPIGLLVVGSIYTMFMILYVERRSWINLFCPVPEFGPLDYEKRRSRKMYRKHEYIGSQAQRQLSRYMLTRDEMEKVHLDIKYDVGRRSTKTQYYNTESDKKTL